MRPNSEGFFWTNDKRFCWNEEVDLGNELGSEWYPVLVLYHIKEENNNRDPEYLSWINGRIDMREYEGFVFIPPAALSSSRIGIKYANWRYCGVPVDVIERRSWGGLTTVTDVPWECPSCRNVNPSGYGACLSCNFDR